MRNALLVGTVLLAAGCSAQPPAPARVSWSYGAGNGDGVSYPGPKPIFKRAYGPGNGDGVTSGGPAPTESYGYGADNASGGMVQMSPEQPRQQVAAPSTAPTPTGSTVAGSHS
jgi:hypothetical protein